MSESERTTEVMTVAPPEPRGFGWKPVVWVVLFVMGLIAYAGGPDSPVWSAYAWVIAIIGFVLIVVFILWLIVWIIRWSVR